MVRMVLLAMVYGLPMATTAFADTSEITEIVAECEAAVAKAQNTYAKTTAGGRLGNRVHAMHKFGRMDDASLEIVWTEALACYRKAYDRPGAQYLEAF